QRHAVESGGAVALAQHQQVAGLGIHGDRLGVAGTVGIAEAQGPGDVHVLLAGRRLRYRMHDHAAAPAAVVADVADQQPVPAVLVPVGRRFAVAQPGAVLVDRAQGPAELAQAAQAAGVATVADRPRVAGLGAGGR